MLLNNDHFKAIHHLVLIRINESDKVNENIIETSKTNYSIYKATFEETLKYVP